MSYVGKGLCLTRSDMGCSGVGSLWPEVRPVHDVAPLTRKMLWKMTGGSDMTQSFVYRDVRPPFPLAAA